MASPVLLGSVLRSQSRAEQAYSWGDHALAGYLLNVVEDTTPQLGGNLDVNGFDITSATNGDIDIYPHGSGTLTLGGTGSGGTVLTAGIGAVSITTLSDNADITLDPHGTGDILLSANVGINEASPDGLLHVSDTAGVTPEIIIDTPNGTVPTQWAIQNNTATGRFTVTNKTGTKSPFKIAPAAAENLLRLGIADSTTVDIGGKLGIGTTAPDVELHILGSGGAVSGGMDPSALGIQAVIENAGTFAQLGLSSASAYGEFVTAQDGTNNPVWIGWYGSSDAYKPNDCEIATNGDLWLYHNTAGDLARIDSAASLFIKEKSGGVVASTSVAGWGQLWVKGTTPCELWFTDDAGTSTKIV